MSDNSFWKSALLISLMNKHNAKEAAEASAPPPPPKDKRTPSQKLRDNIIDGKVGEVNKDTLEWISKEQERERQQKVQSERNDVKFFVIVMVILSICALLEKCGVL